MSFFMMFGGASAAVGVPVLNIEGNRAAYMLFSDPRDMARFTDRRANVTYKDARDYVRRLTRRAYAPYRDKRAKK